MVLFVKFVNSAKIKQSPNIGATQYLRVVGVRIRVNLKLALYLQLREINTIKEPEQVLVNN